MNLSQLLDNQIGAGGGGLGGGFGGGLFSSAPNVGAYTPVSLADVKSVTAVSTGPATAAVSTNALGYVAEKPVVDVRALTNGDWTPRSSTAESQLRAAIQTTAYSDNALGLSSEALADLANASAVLAWLDGTRYWAGYPKLDKSWSANAGAVDGLGKPVADYSPFVMGIAKGKRVAVERRGVFIFNPSAEMPQDSLLDKIAEGVAIGFGAAAIGIVGGAVAAPIFGGGAVAPVVPGAIALPEAAVTTTAIGASSGISLGTVGTGLAGVLGGGKIFTDVIGKGGNVAFLDSLGALGNSTLEAIKNTPLSDIGAAISNVTLSDVASVAGKVTPAQVQSAVYGPPAPAPTAPSVTATAQRVVEASAVPVGLLALGVAAYYFTRK